MGVVGPLVGLLAILISSYVRLPPSPPPPRPITQRIMNKYWDKAEHFRADGYLISHAIRQYVLRGELERAENWMRHLLHVDTQPTAKAFMAVIEGNAGNSQKALHWLELMRNMSKENPELKPPVRAYAFAIASAACSGDAEVAFKLYEEMKENGPSPDAFSYLAALEASKKGSDSRFTRHLSNEMKRLKIENHRAAQKYLIWTMIRSGKPMLIRSFLERINITGLDELAALLQTHAKSGDKGGADTYMRSILNMLHSKIESKELGEYGELLSSAFADVMYASWRSRDVTGALAWYNKSLEIGVEQTYDLRLNALRALGEEDAYKAYRLFNTMVKDFNYTDHAVYSTMIEAFARHKKLQDAHRIAIRFRKMGHKPDPITYATCILNCVETGDFENAESFLDMQLRDRVIPLMDNYGEVIRHVAFSKEATKNRIKLAENWLRRLLHNGVKVAPNIVNYVIDAHGELFQSTRARHWLVHMRKFGVQPSAESYRLVFVACSNSMDSDSAAKTFEELLQDQNVEIDERTYNAGIEALARGIPDIALRRNKAADYFEIMLKDPRVTPNAKTFLAVTRNLIANGWVKEMEYFRDKIFNARSFAEMNVHVYNRIMMVYARAYPPMTKKLVAAFREMCKKGIKPIPLTAKILDDTLGWQARQSLLLQTSNNDVQATIAPREYRSRAGGDRRKLLEMYGDRFTLRSGDDWRCAQCTNVNTPRMTHCSVCDIPKPRTRGGYEIEQSEDDI
mmetsp:Transcript_14396/g.35096  ORF Transcript_14396/g.35096 Transcript_14396/m.35096 type:complete len:739 (-) Transcript_14396:205-2421(-)